MTPEQRFNQWIIDTFKDGDVLRVESLTENGIPDINVCIMGMEAWIESKVAHRGIILLRKEQYAWGMRRHHAGGTVAILALDEYENLIIGYRYPDLRPRTRGDGKTLELDCRSSMVGIRATKSDRILIRKFVFPMI